MKNKEIIDVFPDNSAYASKGTWTNFIKNNTGTNNINPPYALAILTSLNIVDNVIATGI